MAASIIHYNATREHKLPMNKDALRELAANPDFISGIYNYCDRWCERCAFTSRCFLYATEKADPDLDDPEVRDLNNAKFWNKLAIIFKDTHELIKECAAESGVDLDSIEAEAAVTAFDRESETAEKHRLSVLARDYATMVEQWFANELAEEEKIRAAEASTKSEEERLDAADALEVIRWYQFLIAAKVFRALLTDDDELEQDLADDSEDVRDAAQNDTNGSAKVALIAIERSASAWRVVQSCIPDKRESIAPLLPELERLRAGIEQAVPHARDFIRPGFDEVISEFAS